jgi:hypothetical protein
VFFAIWWAWMNFTWFASAYDTDGLPYRLAALVEIAGVLILAAGVPRAFERRDFTVAAVGYVVMRLALVGQWVRAAATDLGGRPAALRYAIGVSACQVGWLFGLALPVGWAWWRSGPGVAELLVPVDNEGRQARDLQIIAGYDSPLIIAARAAAGGRSLASLLTLPPPVLHHRLWSVALGSTRRGLRSPADGSVGLSAAGPMPLLRELWRIRLVPSRS